MVKKCDLKKWFIIGLLIVVIFFLFHSFSAMNRVEGFGSDPCTQYTNCNSCSSANVGGSNPNAYGGICGWCKQTGTCMSTEHEYYMNNQSPCKCSTDTQDCNRSNCGNTPNNPDNNDMHPILKWFLIKTSVTPTTTTTTITATPDATTSTTSSSTTSSSTTPSTTSTTTPTTTSTTSTTPMPTTATTSTTSPAPVTTSTTQVS